MSSKTSKDRPKLTDSNGARNSVEPTELDVTQLHRFLGAVVVAERTTLFCVWAPAAQRVDVLVHCEGQESETQRVVPLLKKVGGYHVVQVEDCGRGDRYWYRVDDGEPRPDPVSRFQPDGVHRASEIVDIDFDWKDQTWNGINRDDLIIYELHVGAFTTEGTFLSAIDRLPELIELGITAIELMPVAASAGRWNWGYDGVGMFAPSANFGSPNDFRELVNAAHGLGLAVILDVVYNHYGPEGNYWGEFGPHLSQQHTTPWGAAPNFDGDQCREVRRMFAANAIYWLDEFHLDGLRVDAIHCMNDESTEHVVTEIGKAVSDWSRSVDRQVLMIAESNVYDSEMLQPISEDGHGFDAEWCDDFLHSTFAVLRPGEQLCHRQYSPDDLAETLRTGFVYQGTLRHPRERRVGASCGVGTDRVDTSGLIYSIQNHDFIGNHPLGKRLHQVTSHDAHRAAAALLILSPAIPMFFMGEEFACEHPYCFFVDFDDSEMRTSVVDGRKREYPQHDWSSGVLPTEPAAFHAAKIGDTADGNMETLNWYQALIQIRKRWCKAGWFNDGCLSVDIEQELGIYSLHYRANENPATVGGSIVVRLSADESQGPVQIDLPVGLKMVAKSRDENDEMLYPNHAMVFQTVAKS